MKNLKTWSLTVATLLSVGVLVLTIPSRTANASTAAKVVKTTNLKNTIVHLSSQGNMYTSNKLTKVAWKNKDWQHFSLMRYSQVTVKKSNGKTAVYQYVRNNGVYGWVWNGYVKSGPATEANQISNTNKSAYVAASLKTLNQFRSKHGVPALKIDSSLNKLAESYAFDEWQYSTTFGDGKEDGIFSTDLTKADGFAGDLSDCETTSSKARWSKYGKDDIASYFDKQNGSSFTSQQSILLNKKYTRVGIGIYNNDAGNFGIMAQAFKK